MSGRQVVPDWPSHSFITCTFWGRICEGVTIIVDHRQGIESTISPQRVLTLRSARGSLAGLRSLMLPATQYRNISHNVSAGKEGDCTADEINADCDGAACRAHFPFGRRPSVGIKFKDTLSETVWYTRKWRKLEVTCSYSDGEMRGRGPESEALYDC
jgi:hypothetical protein